MAACFAAVAFGLMVAKHNSFHTRALDLAKFDQAIWNTLYGRFLFSSIQSHSILGNHFSPLMAAVAPLYLVWPNVRVLFLVQSIGLAAAGLCLYQIVRAKHARLAPWFLLAFYLNPALHEVALVEYRRVTMAVPYLALAAYALFSRRRVLMTIALGVALLCKENIGLIVAMFGLYLLLFERDWKWGAPLIVVGLSWTVIVTLWVIPAFQPPTKDAALYPQLNYFGLSGDSYQEILAALWRDPLALVRGVLDRAGMRALFRVFLPLGFVLPLLAADWLLIVLPSMAYMLMSVATGMHQLRDWYMASVLPGLFAAIAVGLGRLAVKRARWAVVGLLAASAVGYGLFSHAPPGAKYRPDLYRVTDHHRLRARLVAAVPPGASVAAQDPYVPHLSQREHIYLYPWVSIGIENVDYVLLDRALHPYPLQPHRMADTIDNALADPRYAIVLEGDGAFLFRQGGVRLPAKEIGAVVDGTMLLERIEVAPRDPDGLYRVADDAPIDLRHGQEVRIGLYWRALAAPEVERTVSVRMADASGALAAIHDGLPGAGKKPTSWWEKGWEIRDVHYLTVSPDAAFGPGRLQILVYDSHTLENVPFDDIGIVLVAHEIRVVE
jgi:uncharacterized membrane protein